MGNKEHDEEENDLYDAVAQNRKDHPEFLIQNLIDGRHNAHLHQCLDHLSCLN